MVRRYDKSLYHDEGIFYTEKGSDTVPEYILDFPKRGGVCLKQTGEKPLYAMIQANKVNCDLHSVLETVVHENQQSVVDLATVNDVIADFTVPSTLGELYSGMKRVEQTWNELPIEVRESFGSDVRSFVREIGTDSFTSKLESGYSAYNNAVNKRISIKRESVSFNGNEKLDSGSESNVIVKDNMEE